MGAPELLLLQRLDDRVEALRAEVTALGARLAGSAELGRARTASASAARARDAADAAVRAAERDAAVVRDRARFLDRRLFDGSVRDPTELLTLQRELDEVRVRLAELEDAELSLMEDAETAADAVTAAQAGATAIEEARAASQGPDSERLAELRTELADGIAERDLEVSRRGAAELSLYHRVAGKHRPAVVRLAGDACGGCRVPLGQAEVHAVKVGDGIVQCSRCDRIQAP